MHRDPAIAYGANSGSGQPSGTMIVSSGVGRRGDGSRVGRAPAAEHTSSNADSTIAPRSSTSRPVAAMAAASSYIVRRPPLTTSSLRRKREAGELPRHPAAAGDPDDDAGLAHERRLHA